MLTLHRVIKYEKAITFIIQKTEKWDVVLCKELPLIDLHVLAILDNHCVIV